MTDDRPTRLVLVRHGEAQCHVDQVVGGMKGCTGLSGLGRRQAEALRQRLERTGELADAGVLYASTLPRAIETAEAIAGVVGASTIEQDEDLCELHPGDADGITWEEFRARYAWPSSSADLYRPMAPGAETLAALWVRVACVLLRLATEHEGRTVVIACHGGVIEGSLRALAEMPLAPRFKTRIDNTSITEWERPASDDPHRRWTLVRFNDHAHLL
ncbi:MAG TPA: histidine phosphatase family protein [Acidimicrobiales bacterium]|jgi:2,3-bisphosphoglycerate-dependent phosphoglycerate mutase|nr:histidine phosphatase family protein [Acidimicrobiales bacterium]